MSEHWLLVLSYENLGSNSIKIPFECGDNPRHVLSAARATPYIVDIDGDAHYVDWEKVFHASVARGE